MRKIVAQERAWTFGSLKVHEHLYPNISAADHLHPVLCCAREVYDSYFEIK